MIYLIDTELDSSQKATLTLNDLNPDSAQHLKALRPDLSEKIAFLNLKGAASVYSVTSIKPLELSFVEKIIEKNSPIEMHLFLAPPLGSMLEQSIEQATEVGFDHIHFLRSERVQHSKDKALPQARLKRVVQASCKQCARKWAPQLNEDWQSLSDVIATNPCDLYLVADELKAQAHWGILSGIESIQLRLQNKARPKVGIFIGPEGGWSSDERKSLSDNSVGVLALGPHILKVATAIVASYMLVSKELNSLGN